MGFITRIEMIEGSVGGLFVDGELVVMRFDVLPMTSHVLELDRPRCNGSRCEHKYALPQYRHQQNNDVKSNCHARGQGN